MNIDESIVITDVMLEINEYDIEEVACGLRISGEEHNSCSDVRCFDGLDGDGTQSMLDFD